MSCFPRISKAVRQGEIDADLAALTVGTTGHSRWLTTANLFCDWWCRRHQLSRKLLARLRVIVDFIVNVYYPCWFTIKINNSWVDGPKNILFELLCLRAQSKTVQQTVETTVRTSAWFAHSESVLMSMLCSDNQEERNFAVSKVLAIRGEAVLGDSSLRFRVLPNLNLAAENLVDLIDWEDALEPLVTCRMTKEELEQLRVQPLEVEYFPCHTQAIERAVKEVTAACSAVCGPERRDGFIRGRALHRELMPRLNSKQDMSRLGQLGNMSLV